MQEFQDLVILVLSTLEDYNAEITRIQSEAVTVENTNSSTEQPTIATRDPRVVTVRKHKNKSFVAYFEGYKLSSFTKQSTTLWVEDITEDKPFYKEVFIWEIIEHILEECVLNSLLDIDWVYRPYAYLVGTAIAKGQTTRDKAMQWWKTLQQLSRETGGTLCTIN